ncbi:hypothetical protein Halha_2273 [Halobacteroides halobius DSM 5150]|uniref:Flagellar assembly factor FliW n=1 Tax=Halobacteroides halobius (strain ATCC 35273 / DSM 5150 / MD-1) TaxID=748449 RepID=L0KA06_HALHC|nr:flagellar assembly protein FliW [Halobacteroides halobius]AGB42147.1 hypothetical protein Halha_2273 [Halobacteroides halobius DSM 5150]
MRIETTRFGEIEVSEEEIIIFHQGLYGFKDEKQFMLIEDQETDFFWLQAVHNPDLAFVVTEPWAFCQTYEFDLKESVKRELKINGQEDVLVINIVVVPDNPKEMTMNLKAPLVINKRERIGRQIILEDTSYPVKFKLFSDRDNRKVAGNKKVAGNG